jgi:hypothetical protein
VGTNYFSVKRGLEDLDPDVFWERRQVGDPEADDILHIGKSSGGWCFSLHIIPELGINDLDDWIRVFIEPDRIIINEYRERIDLTEIMRIITARRWHRPEGSGWTPEDYKRNFAEPGPNGLARHALGHGCVKQGEGTWDCITGYFS